MRTDVTTANLMPDKVTTSRQLKYTATNTDAVSENIVRLNITRNGFFLRLNTTVK